MPYKGTNKVAYGRAKKGKTKKERSKIYNIEKKKLEKHFSIINFIKVTSKRNSEEKNIKNNNHLNKNKRRKSKNKYVPKKLILDEIREHMTSKILSHISNDLATFLIRTTCKDLSNDQKNMLRSAIAFITSETISKALERPLKVIDNIKMFIKVNKTIYKVLMYFNEKENEFCIDENKITKVNKFNLEYLKYLNKHQKVKQMGNRIELLDYIGKNVFVKIDRLLDSVHARINEFEYKAYYGYLIKINDPNIVRQDAYVICKNELINEFTGIVKAIIICKSDIKDKLVVCSSDCDVSKDQIKALINLQEKSFDFEIIM